MNLERFKSDHVAILSSVTELKRLVQAGIHENADSIASTIVKMSSTIKLHLAVEDNMLYPALAKSANPEAARKGQAFQSEMGSIANAYLAFARKWNLGSLVAAQPEVFRADANGIFKALQQRIQRENEELYPLAEQA